MTPSEQSDYPFEEFVIKRALERPGQRVTVTGKLPGTRWRPTGGVYVTHEDSLGLEQLDPDAALQLALLLAGVVAVMEEESDRRYGAIERSAWREGVTIR